MDSDIKLIGLFAIFVFIVAVFFAYPIAGAVVGIGVIGIMVWIAPFVIIAAIVWSAMMTNHVNKIVEIDHAHNLSKNDILKVSLEAPKSSYPKEEGELDKEKHKLYLKTLGLTYPEKEISVPDKATKLTLEARRPRGRRRRRRPYRRARRVS